MDQELLNNEQVPATPNQGDATGISNILIDLINDEWEAIQGYNNFLADCSDSYPEMVKVIQDIANEENNHVGMLQKLLSTISPNANTIKEGEQEAEKELVGNEMFSSPIVIDTPVTNIEAIQLLNNLIN